MSWIKQLTRHYEDYKMFLEQYTKGEGLWDDQKVVKTRKPF